MENSIVEGPMVPGSEKETKFNQGRLYLNSLVANKTVFFLTRNAFALVTSTNSITGRQCCSIEASRALWY